jgi:hypothetical protein
MADPRCPECQIELSFRHPHLAGAFSLDTRFAGLVGADRMLARSWEASPRWPAPVLAGYIGSLPHRVGGLVGRLRSQYLIFLFDERND